MRTIAAPAAATFGKALALAQLVKMDLSAPLCVATCRDTITWSGFDFIGGRQTSIAPIRDQGGSVAGLSFTLSGIPTALLAIALSEPIQGKTVTVWDALMDPDTQALLDVVQVWRGTLDVMPISVGPALSSITVQAEHRGITFARPRGIKYVDSDQQALYPGDRCLEFITAQSSHQDTWPAAAFFRQ